MREGVERPRRVLVVEDDNEIATILAEILEAEGYAPVAVSDAAGVEAQLDPRPALVVLDLRLTRDGAASILRSLRARDMADVPVLLLSAASDLPQRAQELGVKSYLAKPFELDDLLVLVRSLV